MTSRRWKLALIIVLPKGTVFFIIPICACINSVRKILGNQIVVTPSIKVIQFSKYLSFHLGVVMVHAKWTNLIVVLTSSDTLSASERAFQAFPQTRRITVRASGEWTAAQHLIGYPLTNSISPSANALLRAISAPDWAVFYNKHLKPVSPNFIVFRLPQGLGRCNWNS